MSKIDTWREPHGSMEGPMAIKSDYVEDVQRLMTELGVDEHGSLQSLDRMTTGDLCRLAEFLDGVLVKQRLLTAQIAGRTISASFAQDLADAAARLRKGLTPESAVKFLQGSGYLDENGEVAKPYRDSLPSEKQT